MTRCKYIDRGDWCTYGCRPGYIFCHHSVRGTCEYQSAKRCRHGYHVTSSVPPPQVDKTRESLKKLGLNEDRQNVDRGLVDAVFRHHAKTYHPDKHPSGLSVGMKAALTAKFREMVAAREHLMTIFPED